MKPVMLALLLIVAGTTFGQTVQKEINEQVWKPFIAAFNQPDGAAFMALHSKDLVRVVRDDGHIMGFDEYSKLIASGNQHNTLSKFQRKIELRFTERWVNGSLACDVGYYKTEVIRPSENNSVHYGKFQVILRKENGVWKILMDSDSSEGSTVTDKDFLFAKPMDTGFTKPAN